MNKIRQILSHKLRLSGIRGCMAAGAMTAGIAALAVIGGVNSEDISTVNLETNVIPEETVTEAATEKKSYSHDIEYFSFEDMKSMTSAECDSDEAEEAVPENEENTVTEAPEVTETEETAAEAETEADCEEEITEETEAEAEEDAAEAEEDGPAPEVTEEYEESDNEEAVSEESIPEAIIPAENVSDEVEEPSVENEAAAENEADEDISESEYSADVQIEETAEQETAESVSARISAAGGDDDNGGLSSALDIEAEENTEAPIPVTVTAAAEEAKTAAAPAAAEIAVPVEINDIPEDITLEDEAEGAVEETVKESTPAPQEGAISLFDLPEWLTFDENGVPTEYTKVLTGKACAYTASPDALMSTGKTVFQGYVAVDPNIIPYGTELYIVAEDGDVYGYAIAADTGYSVRKGHIIVDLFMNEYDDCIQWGNKPVNVYVLN